MADKILRAATCCVLLAAAACAVFYYYRYDPSSGGLPCVFKYATGFDCPGCGAQRAFHALLHGNFVEALRYNALIFILAPVAVFFIYIEVNRREHPRLYARVMQPWVPVTIFLVVTAFWIGRNLAGV